MILSSEKEIKEIGLYIISGKQLREAAEHFKVSSTVIGKRIKELEKIDPSLFLKVREQIKKNMKKRGAPDKSRKEEIDLLNFFDEDSEKVGKEIKAKIKKIKNEKIAMIEYKGQTFYSWVEEYSGKN